MPRARARPRYPGPSLLCGPSTTACRRRTARSRRRSLPQSREKRWRFPDHADFNAFLFPHALSAGLIDRVEITDTINATRTLLERFQAHRLYAEMNAAERLHELPYTIYRDDDLESGVIDVLYRPLAADRAAWHIVDFKADEIRTEEQLAERSGIYQVQLRSYESAVSTLLGVAVQGSLCFLDVRGQLRIVPAAPAP